MINEIATVVATCFIIVGAVCAGGACLFCIGREIYRRTLGE